MPHKFEQNGRVPDPTSREIVPNAKPAARSSTEKLRILAEYEAYPAGAPERGALLRREGIYTSQISKWRKHRDQAALQGLSPQRRGPKPAPRDPVHAENTRLRQEITRLQARLDRAETIIDVQKNFPHCLGCRSHRPRTSRNAAGRRRARATGGRLGRL